MAGFRVAARSLQLAISFGDRFRWFVSSLEISFPATETVDRRDWFNATLAKAFRATDRLSSRRVCILRA